MIDPAAVHGAFEGDTLVIEALLADEVSGAILRDDLDGKPEEEEDLGIRLAKLFVADGASTPIVRRNSSSMSANAVMPGPASSPCSSVACRWLCGWRVVLSPSAPISRVGSSR